jgi:ABC-type transport system substrate-binding protein
MRSIPESSLKKGPTRGFGEPAAVWAIPKASRWYVNLPEVKRDPAKVKALLREAAVGPDVEVVILARTGEEEENQILQQQLTTAGFKTKIDVVETAVSVNRRSQKRILNYSGYCNEEFDRLVQEAGKVSDFKKRYELYAKAIKIVDDDVPEAPLVFTPRFFTYRQKVKGFEADVSDRWTSSTAGLLRTWIGN